MALNLNDVAPRPGPAPQEGQLHERFYALFGGPIAWFLQLTIGYALSSESCFPGFERHSRLPQYLGWTRTALVLVMIGASLAALGSLVISLRAYRRASSEMLGDVRHLVRVGADRTCFLALWGVIFGAGFAVASVLTLIGYFILPPCDG